jgi:DNA-binding GntR family transcriptional regulator
MKNSATHAIVDALTRAIVEHQLTPGAKLVEQKLADQFGVSRTLVRQALYRLSQNRLVTIEPARGAFVSAPSVEEARQVFEVRRTLEAAMTRTFVERATKVDLDALQKHIAQERRAVQQDDIARRTTLLGDFHVRMAELLGNQVLAQILLDLISRSALITLMYQSPTAAAHSHEEHEGIVQALRMRDADLAVQLMEQHLHHVEQTLTFNQSADKKP